MKPSCNLTGLIFIMMTVTMKQMASTLISTKDATTPIINHSQDNSEDLKPVATIREKQFSKKLSVGVLEKEQDHGDNTSVAVINEVEDDEEVQDDDDDEEEDDDAKEVQGVDEDA